jgi:hypothetical protein
MPVRVSLSIIAGAQLIATSILVVGRYEIGHISPGARGFAVYGVDTWTGAPFMRTAATD